MTPALLAILRPLGPWRSGPDSGARDRIDPIFHSDSLYSAVTAAFASLGQLDEWLEATARAQTPAVRLSSCFPYLGDALYVTPPCSMWPPVVSPKVRWTGARFVPLGLVDALLAGDALIEDAWAVDGPSECLVPSRNPVGPFRVALRRGAAIDRMGTAAEPHLTACAEFIEDAGLWTVIAFADPAAAERWTAPVEAALRLLGDTGVGGERSRGWGRFAPPEFFPGSLEELLLPRSTAPAPPAAEAAEPPLPAEKVWWLLSLFAPASADPVLWDRGHYSLVTRSGRIDSPAGSGGLKKQLNMVAEGSVLVASGEVNGAAVDVAPDGFAHPVYRAGFAVALALPEVRP